MKNRFASSFLNSRKSCTFLCAGFLIFILAADVCFAGHTQNIMLTGYWPPTNEMLRKFSTDPNQNPGGWQGQNWEGRGYDIYAYFPEFPGGTGSNPKGSGNFEVDYQDVGSWSPPAAPTGDFWRITDLIHPVAIMSFGQGSGPWEIEYNARNLPSSTWTNDYLSPYKPTPAPPDTTQPSGYVRHSSLPVEAIAEAVNGSGAGINAWVDWDVDPGHFLCEYMAYHDGWYQNLHNDPCDQYYCVAAGFTHLAAGVSVSNGTAGVKAALRALISHLDSQLVQYTISGTVTANGLPLAGVTMCGLPGNPVTNSSGVYTAQVGAGWSGAVTPLKSGYAFTQKTYINVSANQSAQDYTASAATADTIVFDACSSNSSGTAGTTLSWSHTVGSGNNRVLVVSVVTEDSIAADQIISSVKFNGVNMTPISGSTKSRVVYSGSSYSSTLRADLYYMLNPPVGAYTVLITHNGSVSYRAGGAISLNNVKQQVPEAIVTNSATSASISTNINIPNTGAWIVDAVGHSNSGSFTTSTSTERWDRNSGYHTGAGSTKAVTSAGLNTISWTYSGSSGSMVHSLAAFAPSETIPVEQRLLTTSSSAGGTVATPGIGTYWYNLGSDANIVASANTGYHFVNWTGTAVTAGKVTDPNAAGTKVTMDANYTVIANFAINQYTITASAGPNGTINPSGAIIKDYNSSQLFTATPVTGYTVNTWSVDGNTVQTGGTTYTLSNITANHTVTVTFIPIEYTLTINIVGSGTVTKDPNQATYHYGDTVQLTANAATGWQFDSWSGDLSGSENPKNITIDGNKTVITSFAVIQPTISGHVTEPDYITPVEGVLVDINGGGGSDITDANGYYQLTVGYGWSGAVTLHKTGYTFDPNGTRYSNVTTNQQDDYVAILDTFVISGHAVDSVTLTPLAGVLVAPDNNGGPYTNKYYGGGTDTTDVNGYYEVLVDCNWSGNVVPSKYAYTFEPNSRNYIDVNSDLTAGQDYAGILLAYRISGRIKNECNVPIEGVLVSADNGGGSDTTDVNGFYEVWVDYAWSGTVTPTKLHYTFDPNWTSYVEVLADQPDQNYVALNNYDLDCDGSIGWGDVAVIADNWLSQGPAIPGDFVSDETINFLDFAEFGNVWQDK